MAARAEDSLIVKIKEFENVPFAYQANRGDWGRLWMYGIFRRWLLIRILFAILMLICFAPTVGLIEYLYSLYTRFGLTVFSRISQSTKAVWFMLAMLAPAMALYMNILLMLVARFANKREPSDRTITIDDQGVTQRATDIDVLTPWETIQDVRFDRGATYFFLGRFNAVVVPARAFASREQGRAYSDHAAALWQATRKRHADIFAHPFSVVYAHENGDILDLSAKARKDYRFANPAGLTSVSCILGTLVCYVFMLLTSPNMQLNSTTSRSLICIVIVLILIMAIVDPTARLRRQFAKIPGTSDPIEVIINETGILQRTAGGEHFHAWNQVRKIMSTRQLIAFECDENAHIAVPKRAFLAPQAAEYFEYAARTYKEMRRPEPVGESWPPVPVTGS